MKLSMAMVEASFLGEARREMDWDFCALGLAAKMDGVKLPELAEPYMSRLLHRHLQNQLCQSAIEAHWPWLRTKATWRWWECLIRFHNLLRGRMRTNWTTKISDLFEERGWSLTRISEYIATIEPECGVCCRFECEGCRSGAEDVTPPAPVPVEQVAA